MRAINNVLEVCDPTEKEISNANKERNFFLIQGAQTDPHIRYLRSAQCWKLNLISLPKMGHGPQFPNLFESSYHSQQRQIDEESLGEDVHIPNLV